VERSARTATPLGALQSARSQVKRRMWRDEAGRGRAGQAFEFSASGVVGGTTANSLAVGCRGPRQDGQVAKARLLRRSRSRVWTRAWGQREPTAERTGHLNGPARGPGLLKGGLDILATDAGSAHVAGNTRSGRPRAAPGHALGAWRMSTCLTRLPPLSGCAASGTSAHSTSPWPRSHSLRGRSADVPKPQFRGRHERPGFPTANDQVSNELRAALVDEPMAQLHWLRKTGDRRYSVQHNGGIVGHKQDW
jgi:hypothetical protein